MELSGTKRNWTGKSELARFLLQKNERCWNQVEPSGTKWEVTRIFTTLRFWLQCVKTPHFLLFYKTGFYALPDEKLHKLFFQLAGGLSSVHWKCCGDRSIGRFYPRTFHWWLRQCGDSFDWDKNFQVIPTTINLLGSCNFHLSPHSHLLNPFTTFVHHGPHNQTYYVIPKYIT